MLEKLGGSPGLCSPVLGACEGHASGRPRSSFPSSSLLSADTHGWYFSCTRYIASLTFPSLGDFTYKAHRVLGTAKHTPGHRGAGHRVLVLS